MADPGFPGGGVHSKDGAAKLLLPPANEVWGKVIFLHLFVILFTGGSASVHDGIPPPDQAPSGTRPPQDQAPPGTEHAGDTVNARAVRILLECNLVLPIFSAENCRNFRR